MKSNSLYIFDLDNTLVYTDKLNNMSYLFAIDKLNLENRIDNNIRITRKDIYKKYKDLSNDMIEKLIEIKQKYFIENLDQTKPNLDLFEILYSNPIDICVLWTAAERQRVEAILDYYNLNNQFCHIFYTNKKDIKTDIDDICKKFNCSIYDLLVFDDNTNINEFIYNFKKYDKTNLQK